MALKTESSKSKYNLCLYHTCKILVQMGALGCDIFNGGCSRSWRRWMDRNAHNLSSSHSNPLHSHILHGLGASNMWLAQNDIAFKHTREEDSNPNHLPFQAFQDRIIRVRQLCSSVLYLQARGYCPSIFGCWRKSQYLWKKLNAKTLQAR